MDKYLCVVVGQEYLRPMVIYGKNAIELLCDESKHYPYVYLIYEFNDKLDCYIACYHIQDGWLTKISNHKAPNVFISPKRFYGVDKYA